MNPSICTAAASVLYDTFYSTTTPMHPNITAGRPIPEVATIHFRGEFHLLREQHPLSKVVMIG